MLTPLELRGIAEARLQDAELLFTAGRLDGAFYLSGYAVELALKARICQTLDWNSYPSTAGEFKGYQSFRTHDLDILLHLSGVENRIRLQYLVEWSAFSPWSPETRYQPIGTANRQDVQLMIKSARTLLGEL